MIQRGFISRRFVSSILTSATKFSMLIKSIESKNMEQVQWKRPKADVEVWLTAIEDVKEHLHTCLKNNGMHVAVSPHEIYGLVQEEVSELLSEVHDNDTENCIDELLDIAVAAVYGIVSLRTVNFDEDWNPDADEIDELTNDWEG